MASGLKTKGYPSQLEQPKSNPPHQDTPHSIGTLNISNSVCWFISHNNHSFHKTGSKAILEQFTRKQVASLEWEAFPEQCESP